MHGTFCAAGICAWRIWTGPPPARRRPLNCCTAAGLHRGAVQQRGVVRPDGGHLQAAGHRPRQHHQPRGAGVAAGHRRWRWYRHCLWAGCAQLQEATSQPGGGGGEGGGRAAGRSPQGPRALAGLRLLWRPGACALASLWPKGCRSGRGCCPAPHSPPTARRPPPTARRPPPAPQDYLSEFHTRIMKKLKEVGATADRTNFYV
jgi:hypothetical protein